MKAVWHDGLKPCCQGCTLKKGPVSTVGLPREPRRPQTCAPQLLYQSACAHKLASLCCLLKTVWHLKTGLRKDKKTSMFSLHILCFILKSQNQNQKEKRNQVSHPSVKEASLKRTTTKQNKIKNNHLITEGRKRLQCVALLLETRQNTKH